MRVTCPLALKPGNASTVTVTSSPTRTLAKSDDATDARNSNTPSSTMSKIGLPTASIVPASAVRLAMRPERGALTCVRESCCSAIASSVRACAWEASAT